MTKIGTFKNNVQILFFILINQMHFFTFCTFLPNSFYFYSIFFCCSLILTLIWLKKNKNLDINLLEKNYVHKFYDFSLLIRVFSRFAASCRAVSFNSAFWLSRSRRSASSRVKNLCRKSSLSWSKFFTLFDIGSAIFSYVSKRRAAIELRICSEFAINFKQSDFGIQFSE